MANGLPDLDLSVSDDGAIVVRGELDLATAPLLHRALMNAPERPSTVVLDLAGLSFVDSSGLKLLVSQHQRLAHAGGRLELRNVSTQVARVIDLAGFTEILAT